MDQNIAPCMMEKLHSLECFPLATCPEALYLYELTQLLYVVSHCLSLPMQWVLDSPEMFPRGKTV